MKTIYLLILDMNVYESAHFVLAGYTTKEKAEAAAEQYINNNEVEIYEEVLVEKINLY